MTGDRILSANPPSGFRARTGNRRPFKPVADRGLAPPINLEDFVRSDVAAAFVAGIGMMIAAGCDLLLCRGRWIDNHGLGKGDVPTNCRRCRNALCTLIGSVPFGASARLIPAKERHPRAFGGHRPHWSMEFLRPMPITSGFLDTNDGLSAPTDGDQTAAKKAIRVEEHADALRVNDSTRPEFE